MSPRRQFVWRMLGVALFSFAVAAAFSAYLKPAMLIEFANLVLCY